MGLRTVDRVGGLDPDDLGCFSTSIIQSPQLRVGGGQPLVAGPEVWRPRDTFPQGRDRFGISSEHVVGKAEPTRHQRHVEWIEPHMRFDDLDGPFRLSRKDQGRGEARIREIGIERRCPLELGDSGIGLAQPRQHAAEVGVGLRQILVQLDGPAGEFVGPSQGGRVQKISIQCHNPGKHVGPSRACHRRGHSWSLSKRSVQGGAGSRRAAPHRVMSGTN